MAAASPADPCDRTQHLLLDDSPAGSAAAKAVAVLAHGAGSSADFLRRAFPPSRLGVVDLDVVDDRTGDVRIVVDRLKGKAEQHIEAGRHVLLGGVSVGSHAAALAAAQLCEAHAEALSLAAVMPAWLGPGGSPALSALVSVTVTVGPASTIANLRRDPTTHADWITDELDLAWRQRPTLASELRQAAASPAPDLAVLRGLGLPSVVVALRDDPVHPVSVARKWATALPECELVTLERQDPGNDRAKLADAVRAGLCRLSESQ